MPEDWLIKENQNRYKDSKKVTFRGSQIGVPNPRRDNNTFEYPVVQMTSHPIRHHGTPRQKGRDKKGKQGKDGEIFVFALLSNLPK